MIFIAKFCFLISPVDLKSPVSVAGRDQRFNRGDVSYETPRDNFISYLSTEIPCISGSVFIASPSSSVARTKSSPDSWQPCFTPRLSLRCKAIVYNATKYISANNLHTAFEIIRKLKHIKNLGNVVPFDGVKCFTKIKKNCDAWNIFFLVIVNQITN